MSLRRGLASVKGPKTRKGKKDMMRGGKEKPSSHGEREKERRAPGLLKTIRRPPKVREVARGQKRETSGISFKKEKERPEGGEEKQTMKNPFFPGGRLEETRRFGGKRKEKKFSLKGRKGKKP